MNFRRSLSIAVAAAVSAVSVHAMAQMMKVEGQIGGDAAAAPETRPAAPEVASPTTAPAADAKLVIAPDVQKKLDAVRDAYHNLKSLDLVGEMNGNIDVQGQKQTPHFQFTAQYLAPGQFRHEGHQSKANIVLGSTGTQVYMLVSPDKDAAAPDQDPTKPAEGGTQPAQYMTTAAPKEKPDLTDPEGNVQQMLQEQNPSLALAVTDDAEKLLLDGATSVKTADDVTIDGVKYPAISISSAQNDVKVVLDAKTNLVKRLELDLTKQAKAAGAPNVVAALLTFDYSKDAPDSPDIKADKFAWTPPQGAQEIKNDQPDALTLIGQAAPALKLTGLDGAVHSLADLKGSVVVLDFWATWCGPCKASLPHLNELYNKESPNGLKLFAVNEGEDKDTAQKFITDNKYSFPVLLDTDSAAGQTFKVTGIPQTVVIGKDGNVTKVFVGFGAGAPAKLQKAVEAAMKAPAPK